MTPISKILFHKEPLQIISELSRSKKGVLNKKKSPLDKISARMDSHSKDFEINFECDLSNPTHNKLDVGQNHRTISFQFGKRSIVFESLYLSQHAIPRFKGSVDFFYTNNYSKKKKYYYRLIIPLNKKMDFHFQIEQIPIHNDLGYWARTGTKAIIDQTEVFAYSIPDKKKNKDYLFIESDSLDDFDGFSKKAFALKNAIGYLTGFLPGDKGFFFAYTKKEMKIPEHYYFCGFRDTIDSSYTPLNYNPFAYLRSKRKTAETYYKEKTLRVVNISELSNLSQKLHDSLEFSSLILLILESSIATLLFMPGGFAIALESLSDIIIAKDKIKLAPIKDKAISKLVRRECGDVINRHCGAIDPVDLKTLLGRIDQINQTTNTARLRAPFKKLDIDLLQADLELLATRNDLLHGRMPDITSAGANRGIDRINKDLYYASIRFYTLLNILILKWIGFDNYVINYPKMREGYCKIKLKEKPYRKV